MYVYYILLYAVNGLNVTHVYIHLPLIACVIFIHAQEVFYAFLHYRCNLQGKQLAYVLHPQMLYKQLYTCKCTLWAI